MKTSEISIQLPNGKSEQAYLELDDEGHLVLRIGPFYVLDIGPDGMYRNSNLQWLGFAVDEDQRIKVVK